MQSIEWVTWPLTPKHPNSKNDTDVAHHNFQHPSTDFGNFWQICCWESMLSNGDLLSHLSKLMCLHYLGKCWNAKIASFLSHAVLVHCQTLTVAGLIYSVMLLTSHAVAASIETSVVSWGGKIKQLLIGYFLGNISAKNCQNPFMFVIVIMCNISIIFWDTVYILHCLSYLHSGWTWRLHICCAGWS